MNSNMKIIAGLGNPGLRYKNTRHNIGFKVVDHFAEKHGIKLKKKGFNGVYGVGTAASTEVILIKPLTYMNLSGETIRSVLSRYGTDPSDLLVVTDDFAIPFGGLRMREKGSSGGHNGLRSIIEFIGEDFPRLRVGIGAEDLPDDKSGYVLASFNRKERACFGEILDKTVIFIEEWLVQGAVSAMNKFN